MDKKANDATEVVELKRNNISVRYRNGVIGDAHVVDAAKSSRAVFGPTVMSSDTFSVLPTSGPTKWQVRHEPGSPVVVTTVTTAEGVFDEEAFVFLTGDGYGIRRRLRCFDGPIEVELDGRPVFGGWDYDEDWQPATTDEDEPMVMMRSYGGVTLTLAVQRTTSSRSQEELWLRCEGPRVESRFCLEAGDEVVVVLLVSTDPALVPSSRAAMMALGATARSELGVEVPAGFTSRDMRIRELVELGRRLNHGVTVPLVALSRVTLTAARLLPDAWRRPVARSLTTICLGAAAWCGFTAVTADATTTGAHASVGALVLLAWASVWAVAAGMDKYYGHDQWLKERKAARPWSIALAVAAAVAMIAGLLQAFAASDLGAVTAPTWAQMLVAAVVGWSGVSDVLAIRRSVASAAAIGV